jgi:hypothetical protein
MIPLGHISAGPARMASRAVDAAVRSGRVAVFLGRSGEGAAIAYTDPGYAWALRRHVRYLVGVYQDDLADNEGLRAQLIADIRTHLPAARKVA